MVFFWRLFKKESLLCQFTFLIWLVYFFHILSHNGANRIISLQMANYWDSCEVVENIDKEGLFERSPFLKSAFDRRWRSRLQEPRGRTPRGAEPRGGASRPCPHIPNMVFVSPFSNCTPNESQIAKRRPPLAILSRLIHFVKYIARRICL